MIRRALCLAVLCLSAAPASSRAAGIPAPPGLLAMWNGRDGAAVRADLRRFAAEGERPGTTAGGRLDAGEAAYWLGVQDERAGRPDSALANWRRALALRGDFDEGFALIDALLRRGHDDDLLEARALAGSFAQQSGMAEARRVPEAHARLAWALHRLGRPDSALAELREHCAPLQRRPVWARRFAMIESAAGDHDAAWRRLVPLSALGRRRDPEVETLLVRTQRALQYSDERRRISVEIVANRLDDDERLLAEALGGRIETVQAKDGFALQTFTFPAARDSVRRSPVLLVPSPADTLAAVDSLVAALTAAGHPVALLAARGSFGSVGPGAWGPESWLGRQAELDALCIGDASVVMDQLSRRPDFAGAPWIVGAAGERATVALGLTRSRRNARALLLIAPRVPLVEVAEFRARLRAARTRTYVQVSPEEPAALEFGDLLARDTPAGQVRVADSGLAGRGTAVFRADAKIAKRLIAWLAEKPAAR